MSVSLCALACAAATANATAATVTARAAAVGPAPAAHALQLVLPLKVDGAGLRRLALEVSDPTSPLYGHYESISTLSRRFGASPAVRRRVISYLRTQGARDVRIDATGLFAEATVPVAAAERLFAAPLMRFHAAGGSRFLAPLAGVQPRVPRSLEGAVTGVLGLDTAPMFKASDTVLRRSGATAAAAAGYSSALPRTGTPAGCAAGQAAGESGGNASTAAFTPNQYLTAYDYNSLHGQGYLGQGERAAVIELDSVSTTDVTAFAQCFGLQVPSIAQHLAGISGPPPAGVESTLDLDMLEAAAPRLSSVDVYETGSAPATFIVALAAPFANPALRPAVLSISLGACDDQVNQSVTNRIISLADAVLSEGSIEGTSVLAASGDAGSTGCTNASGAPIFDRSLGLGGVSVAYPSDSPFALAVGGTNLALTPANGIAQQIVWNEPQSQPWPSASGGGFSDTYRREVWQDQAFPLNIGLLGGNPMMARPDVAMLADTRPGYAVYCTTADCAGATGSPWIAVGGTSASTPLLAGGLALIDQALGAHHRVTVGPPAPLLYSWARSSHMRSYLFNDVTVGNNDIGAYLAGSGGQPTGCCSALPGFDRASGWGSVDLAHLAQAYLSAGLPTVPLRMKVRVPADQHPGRTGRFRVIVSCSGDCYPYANVYFTIGAGRVSHTVAGPACSKTGCFELSSSVKRLRAAGSQRLTVRLSHAQVHLLRSALKRHLRVRATVYGILWDPRLVLTGPGDVYALTAPKRVTITN